MLSLLVMTLCVVQLWSGFGVGSPGQASAGRVVQAAGAIPPPVAGCTPLVTPTGQAWPTDEPEPQYPAWCYALTASEPTTRLTGANDWLDTFQTNVAMGRLADGDLGYRVFDRVNNGGTNQTRHFINNNHWMDDNAGGFDGGTMLRPNRAFSFEQGKLVVEGDVAAGMAGYQRADGGDIAWPEIDISTAPAPTGSVSDNLYAYGQFGGAWTVGCRLNSGGNPICAVESASAVPYASDSQPCFPFQPSRLVEVSWFEACGSSHSGGLRSGDLSNYFRQCQPNQMDMFCRDRFRMELTQSGLTLYVNGRLYFQDAGWPAGYQLPDSMVNGGPVYTYFSDWEDQPADAAYRFHWGRLAVNPHDAAGQLVPPSAAPSFCLGQPQNTCPMGMPTPTATATATAAGATATSTPTATPKASPTATTTPRASATPTATSSPVTASAGAYHALSPARIYDSRQGAGPLGPGKDRTIGVAGQGGVPTTGAGAVVLNVTATNTTTSGALVLFPVGGGQSLTPNLIWSAGQTSPNLVEVALSAGGQVSLGNVQGSADVIVDVEGWVDQAGPAATAGRFQSLAPRRIYDTRLGPGALGPNETRLVPVAGQGGVPGSGVAAVVLNVAATNPTAQSFLTVYASGAAQPIASNLNVVAGQTASNRVIVPVGSDGRIAVFNAGGNIDVVVDVSGWFTNGTNGSLFTPVAPAHLLDTRSSSPLTGGQPRAVQVSGQGGLPSSGVRAVVLNVTAIGPTLAGYLVACPAGVGVPGTSDLNWAAGETVPNLVVVQVGANGQIDLYTPLGSVNVLVDVVGWYG